MLGASHPGRPRSSFIYQPAHGLPESLDSSKPVNRGCPFLIHTQGPPRDAQRNWHKTPAHNDAEKRDLSKLTANCIMETVGRTKRETKAPIFNADTEQSHNLSNNLKVRKKCLASSTLYKIFKH